MVIAVTDLERLGDSALEEFANGSSRDMDRPATRLEAKLEQLYGIAVTMAQQEPSLNGVAAIWNGMVTICDRMAKVLAETAKGSAQRFEAYDRILDIRNACEENRALHA